MYKLYLKVYNNNMKSTAKILTFLIGSFYLAVGLPFIGVKYANA